MSIKEFTKALDGTGHNRAYGTITAYEAGGKYNYGGSYACYGLITQWYKLNVTKIYSGLFANTEEFEPLASEYWKFIFDPDKSPWKDTLPCEMILNKKDRPIGYVIDCTKAPSKLMVNFMIATRLAEEWPRHVNSWKYFKEQGFTEIEALYLSNTFNVDEKGEWSLVNQMSAHYPFNSNLSFKKLNKGNYGKAEKTFNEGGYYTPGCNSIWDLKGESVVRELLKEDQKYKGSFMKMFQYQMSANGMWKSGVKENALEILKSDDSWRKV